MVIDDRLRHIDICMNNFYVLTVKDMETLRYCDISHNSNLTGICTSENSAQKWITKLYDYYFSVLYIPTFINEAYKEKLCCKFFPVLLIIGYT
jgi:hypothetical protein